MIRVGRATIELVHESIATQRVDLVVNPSNTYLWMKHGIAGVLKRQGGDQIEHEAMAKGPIRVGEVVVTGPGNLPCGRVAHAAIMSHDLKATAESIRQAVTRVIEVAEALRVATLALPPMTSPKALSPDLVAAAMFEPMLQTLPETTHLRLVRVCFEDRHELASYKAVLLRFFEA